MVSLALALTAIACAAKNTGADVSPSAAVADAPTPRLVSLAPALTEIVKALGGTAHLVGVTSYCDAPGVPVVGDFAPRPEAVMAARPDVVLMAGYPSQAQTAAALRALDLEVQTLPLVSIADMHEATRAVGRLLRRDEEADAVVQRLVRAIAASSSSSGPAPAEPSVEVLLVYDVQPGFVITTAGGDHVTGLLGHLAAHGMVKHGPLTARLGLEEVLREDPDMILHVAPDPRFPDSAAALKHWSTWPELRAVQRRQVYVYPDDGLAKNGPHLAEVVPKLAALIEAARGHVRADAPEPAPNE